ncbi:MAG: hypothetical protein A2268_00920 [Candidatus Raymondbacteria bacterium RifOxyA12_full_50_37]|uniref:DUF932 domain-containing protein n=1 Tax=Candidatus Raymondbacteria bacterium RIFOXYD12_FULL_49_13 TaxID=1817890 RepID=A0A1F7FGA6_UNCRA|nr:MAG: hypothetical protein A2268_00920 [Candidatus Raymondbacteria bacterium RifOxyA12_full_50_37]OGJ86365.1 MAG: hypothetical protein A2248_13885 [Candidatus Raymondbacteria bacterium RIFOXYA2_FULL_49_16]OGJ95535.1 MAG: hypothetical protein A2453_12660 [Candidatus Raymondbacteria bacterium RIFOXYC2_FULL_50_21]OGJ96254.1 MAG: hypothetical protein A2350_02310 [Candidatus Raymondbacteria bacterium RifOxyB12_full_50_8]OGK05496.1 MAG: hypothetical protein A2519_05245 [Candidatus Raymondbacteria b
MKEGRSITALAEEVELQAKAKKDYVVPTSRMHMTDTATLALDGVGTFDFTEHAHEQLAQRLDIPRKYYDRMRPSPGLLQANVNHWFTKEPEKRMVRTFQNGSNTVRAILSDRYHRFDNYDLMAHILPILKGLGNDVIVASSEITEKKLYLKCVFPKLQQAVKVGDMVQSGLMISNSEVGCASFQLTRFIYRLVCLNGMVMEDGRTRRYHIGARQGVDESISHLLSDETVRADDQAFWFKVRDLTTAAAKNDEEFSRHVQKLRDATKLRVEAQPVDAITALADTFVLNEFEHNATLEHYIRDSDFSLYGMAQALTRTSADVKSYDRATELEKFGGQLINISGADWHTISKAGVN